MYTINLTYGALFTLLFTLSLLTLYFRLLYVTLLRRTDMLQNIELLHLQMILRLLQISSFNGKMNALNEINRIVCPMLYNHRHVSCPMLYNHRHVSWWTFTLLRSLSFLQVQFHARYEFFLNV